MEEEQLSLKIGRTVLDHYAKLGARGKPLKNRNEWTHMAAICIADKDNCINVVSLATGTKCLGGNEINNEGFSVNDSHAEVLCRRAFIRFLYLELEKVFKSQSSNYFKLNDDNPTSACLKSNLSLHMFLTHTPCGDASIFPKLFEETLSSAVADELETDVAIKKRKIVSDIHRTGAKCVPTGEQDAHLGGVDYHTVGMFRIKPGRGDPTLSMCCTDKLTKWVVLGIQGCLTSLFVEPLYLKSIIIGSCPFSKEAFERAIFLRNGEQLPMDKNVHIIQIDLPFNDSRQDTNDQNSKPCPISIVWHLNLEKVETLVDGYKQGVNKNKKASELGQSIISRRNLFHKFLTLYTQIYKTSLFDLSYADCKGMCADYIKKWKILRQFYAHWITDERKIEVKQFKLNVIEDSS